MSALRAGLAAMSKFARLNTSQIMALARRFNRLQERTKNLPLEEVQELVSLFDWMEITYSFPGIGGLSGMVELTVYGYNKEDVISFYILCQTWEE